MADIFFPAVFAGLHFLDEFLFGFVFHIACGLVFEGHVVALSHLFPQFLGVGCFGNIVEVALVVGDPATVQPEVVSAEALSLFLAPFFLVTVREAHTGLFIEVNADGVEVGKKKTTKKQSETEPILLNRYHHL